MRVNVCKKHGIEGGKFYNKEIIEKNSGPSRTYENCPPLDHSKICCPPPKKNRCLVKKWKIPASSQSCRGDLFRPTWPKVWPMHFDSRVIWRPKTQFLLKSGGQNCLSEAAQIGFWPSYDPKIKMHVSNLLAKSSQINLPCGWDYSVLFYKYFWFVKIFDTERGTKTLYILSEGAKVFY